MRAQDREPGQRERLEVFPQPRVEQFLLRRGVAIRAARRATRRRRYRRSSPSSSPPRQCSRGCATDWATIAPFRALTAAENKSTLGKLGRTTSSLPSKRIQHYAPVFPEGVQLRTFDPAAGETEAHDLGGEQETHRGGSRGHGGRRRRVRRKGARRNGGPAELRRNSKHAADRSEHWRSVANQRNSCFSVTSHLATGRLTPQV
jgi:hypothetical protein